METASSAKMSAPDSTAVRVALWRALHVELDAPPHVLVDTVGLRLADPDPQWRSRGDMHPDGTRAFRASIVARARYLDDLVVARAWTRSHSVTPVAVYGSSRWTSRAPRTGNVAGSPRSDIRQVTICRSFPSTSRVVSPGRKHWRPTVSTLAIPRWSRLPGSACI